jgi:cell division protein FtsA
MDRQILEVIPQTYIVDSQPGIRDPLHMIGVRLESEVNIITCSTTSAQNLVKCVNRAGFRVNGLILQALAAGRSVLTEELKEMGVALIDLGGGTSNVLAYGQGSPFLTVSVPVGGYNITNDISMVGNITLEAAEKVKVEAGCCWEPLLDGQDEEIIVPGMAGRTPITIPRSQIVQIIRPRMTETFALIREKLERACPLRNLAGGIVLTGGGANLQGVAELAEEVFHLPARIGYPLPVGGLVDEYRDPVYATAVGLVLEGAKRGGNFFVKGALEKGVSEGDPFGFLKRIGHWVKKEFF